MAGRLRWPEPPPAVRRWVPEPGAPIAPPASAYRTSRVGQDHASDPDTLLATHLGGQPLDPDHGFPLRLIAPNRPGVLQTKWVTTVDVR